MASQDTPRKGPSGPEWVYPTTDSGEVLTVQPDGTVAPQSAASTLVFPVADAGDVLVVQPVTGLAVPKPAPAEAAHIELRTPQVVLGAGAGGFITLNKDTVDNAPAVGTFVYDAAALTINQKLEVGIDASTKDETTLAVTELRANRTYWVTGGVLTLLNDSTVFTSADLQLEIVGNTLALQINQAAAAGHTKTAVGSMWVRVVTVM